MKLNSFFRDCGHQQKCWSPYGRPCVLRLIRKKKAQMPQNMDLMEFGPDVFVSGLQKTIMIAKTRMLKGRPSWK